jgi:hypothetical protein
MSTNLHLKAGKLTFALFQTPTELSVQCRNKSSDQVLALYTKWARGLYGNDPDVEDHLTRLREFLTGHPNHTWSIW